MKDEKYTVFNSFPELETKHFRLIKIERKHASDLFEIYGDEDTMKFMQSNCLQQVEEAETIIDGWLENFQNKKGIRWGIVFKENPSELVGTIALHYWSEKSRRIELGADINKKYWGSGVSTEVTKKIISFGFKNFGINRMELRCDPRNAGSRAIAKKLGFTFEGTLREYIFIKGKGYLDESIYSLLKSDL